MVQPAGQRLAVISQDLLGRTIAGQSRPQTITDRAPRSRQTIADHRQHSLIPLLGHAQLPHRGSVKDQPKQLSSISRNTVRHQPKTKCQASTEVIHHNGAPGMIRTCDTGFRRAVLYPLSYEGGRDELTGSALPGIAGSDPITAAPRSPLRSCRCGCPER
jgi:hypothetical protein